MFANPLHEDSVKHVYIFLSDALVLEEDACVRAGDLRWSSHEPVPNISAHADVTMIPIMSMLSAVAHLTSRNYTSYLSIGIHHPSLFRPIPTRQIC